MTTHRELHAFTVPRCPAVPVPTVAEIVRHPPPRDFFLWGLKPDRALAADLGNVLPLEYEPSLPYRERSRGLPMGRVVAYRDGILFLPNTTKAVLAEVGRDLKTVVAAHVAMLSVDFDLKAHFMTGADKEIAESAGKALEHLEELLSDEHEGGHQHVQAAAVRPEIPSIIRSALAKSGAIVLPYAQLVKVAVIEASPDTLWQRMTSAERKLVYLLRESADGARAAYCFSLTPDADKNVPFAFITRVWDWEKRPPGTDYSSGKLSWTEAMATVLVGARAASDIGTLWLAAERERLDANTLRAIRVQASAIEDAAKRALYVAGAVGQERKRHGTTDAMIARIVLERLGNVADALDNAPYAKHGLANPVAALKATAAS